MASNSHQLRARAHRSPALRLGVVLGAMAAALVVVTPAVAADCAQNPQDASCAHDVAIAMAAEPNPIIAGTTLTYTFSIRNNGPSPAFDVVADLGFPVLAAGLPDGCTGEPTRMTCSLGSLQPGEATSVSVDMPVLSNHRTGLDPHTVSTLVAVGNVSSTGGTDTDGGNNHTSSIVEVFSFSDLDVTKTSSRPGASAGETVDYTITVTNKGPSDADRLTVVDALPDPREAAFVTATASDGGTCQRDATANKLSCTWPIAVGVGSSRTVTARVAVTDSGQANSFSDEATASSVWGDPVTDNNRASVTTTVVTAPTKVTPTPVVTRLLPGVDLYLLILTAKVERTDMGQPVVGRQVRFVADNGAQLCTSTTDATGVARCPGLLQTAATLLRLGYKVHWDGDARYAPSSGKGQIIKLGR